MQEDVSSECYDAGKDPSSWQGLSAMSYVIIFKASSQCELFRDLPEEKQHLR